MTSQSAPASEERVQVIIVDDNEDAAGSLAMLLDLEGISSRTAYDGETALALAETLVPVLMLIDIGLPRMNGYELAARLRSKPALAGAKLIALTGRDLQANDAGDIFDQFWAKPFDPKRLLTEVKAIIESAAP